MTAASTDDRIGLTARLAEAFGLEVARRDPAEPTPWPNLPDVAAMTAHVGGIHRWVAGILRTGRPVAEDGSGPPAGADRLDWYREGRTLLLETLAAVPPDTPCWVIGNRTGTAAFWRRRMVYEHAKHLMDVRAAGGERWRVAEELSAADYTDGIDELLAVFLPRSRPTLAPLPGAVQLVATDTGRRWWIGGDWSVDAAVGEPAARVTAPAADLALALWERAEPLDEPERFRLAGNRATLAAFWGTAIHPW